MKKRLKPAAWLPILTGLVVGAVLFWVGLSADAPGMCLIGLSIAFVLAMWGLSNAGVVRKGFLAPILLLCFGAGGILLSIMLLLNGEFESRPWLAAIGVALGIALIVLGAARWRAARTSASARGSA